MSVHDLRTILTRFKLELALIGDSPEVEAMRKDVDEMNEMLEGYLAFARGNSGETPSRPTWRRRWRSCAATPSARPQSDRRLPGLPVVTVKPAALKRCLANWSPTPRATARRSNIGRASTAT